MFLLSKANQQVQALARERYAEYGVTTTQYAVLRVLWEQDGQSASELGLRLQLDAPTMVGLLDRMEQSGLLERRPHPKDRRINRIYLTGQGKALKKPLSKIIDQINADVEAQFGPDLVRVRQILAQLGQVKTFTAG